MVSGLERQDQIGYVVIKARRGFSYWNRSRSEAGKGRVCYGIMRPDEDWRCQVRFGMDRGKSRRFSVCMACRG